jgi:hypothetical protein
MRSSSEEEAVQIEQWNANLQLAGGVVLLVYMFGVRQIGNTPKSSVYYVTGLIRRFALENYFFCCSRLSIFAIATAAAAAAAF